MLSMAHLTPRGDTKSAGSSSKQMPHDQDRTVHSMEANRTAVEHRGRTPRSRRDQAAIAARSSRARGDFGAGSAGIRLPSIDR